MAARAFGEQLLAWRRFKGLTQSGLSELSGIPRPNISDLECTRVDPTLSTLRRLAVSLGITLGRLLEDQPFLEPLDRMTLDVLTREAVMVNRRSAAKRKLPLEILKIRHKIKTSAPLSRRLRQLERILAYRRAAATGKNKFFPIGIGVRLRRYLKAELGEHQWKMLEARLDKHGGHEAIL